MQSTEREARDTYASTREKLEETTCCIVGGGPGGAILALLLARKGVEVTLLEEHMDFERDFRGDTVHPSTMEILEEIGIIEHILQLKHTKARQLQFNTIEGQTILVNDFSHLKTRYPYIALIPQARFLECITQEASRYPTFHLIMGARAEKLVEEDGYIHGVQYRAHDGWHELRAVLTVGADGRFSRVRKLAGFEPHKTSTPRDVLWFRLPRAEGDPPDSGFVVGAGHFLVRLDRGDTWQFGYAITKGSYQEIKAAGLEKFHQDIGRLMPVFVGRIEGLNEWKQISVLSVESSYIDHWYKPGLLLIGDAAHVMSPVGGVGINYAVQDAVAAANILTENLKVGKVRTEDLARVQRRREKPTHQIQAFQNRAQGRMGRSLEEGHASTLPLLTRMFLHLPMSRTRQAKLIAFGPRPEHVNNP